MGWLRDARKSWDDFLLRDRNFERDAAAWAAWASEHGWTYQADATLEMTGSYRPKYMYGSEQYCHLLSTQRQGLRLIAFEYRRYAVGSQGNDPIRSVQSHIVLHLPGLPPKEFVKMGAGKAMRKLGGMPPSGHDLELVGDELVARGQGHLDPISLEADAENLALQVANVPASFWQPVS